MKYLILIAAVVGVSTPSHADFYGGLEAEYTFTKDKSQSAGAYVGYTWGNHIAIGPQVSIGVIDRGDFMVGEIGAYGDVALQACAGKKLRLCLEGGYEYIHFDADQYHDYYSSAGLDFPIGSTLRLGVDYKVKADDFDGGSFIAGVSLDF